MAEEEAVECGGGGDAARRAEDGVTSSCSSRKEGEVSPTCRMSGVFCWRVCSMSSAHDATDPAHEPCESRRSLLGSMCRGIR